MSFARTMGEGPHFYEWMREFNDSEADRRVMLILNTDNHLTVSTCLVFLKYAFQRIR